jgi:hypothetical protein
MTNCGQFLRLAGMEIRKLNFGRKDSPLLQLMRRVLREAKTVARAEPPATGSRKENVRLDRRRSSCGEPGLRPSKD